MARRIYLLPWGAFGTNPNANFPKYISGGREGPAAIPVQGFQLINQGVEGPALAAVWAEDATHAELAGQSDVLQVPEPLDDTLSAAQASNIAARFESLKIPGDWVAAGMTRREVVRRLARMFLFFQRLHSTGWAEKIMGGITLDSTFNALASNVRTRLQDVATSMGYGTINPSTPMRSVLKHLYEAWTLGVIRLGGEEV